MPPWPELRNLSQAGADPTCSVKLDARVSSQGCRLSASHRVTQKAELGRDRWGKRKNRRGADIGGKNIAPLCQTHTVNVEEQKNLPIKQALEELPGVTQGKNSDIKWVWKWKSQQQTFLSCPARPLPNGVVVRVFTSAGQPFLCTLTHSLTCAEPHSGKRNISFTAAIAITPASLTGAERARP